MPHAATFPPAALTKKPRQ